MSSHCFDPLDFPKRPNNRPGLPRIDYRIGRYAEFREAMIRWLNTEPLLRDWTHRKPDDPGIALLEGAAVLSDILTFYQELYANEAYLRTAQWRDSLSDLVRLLGYRLSPGLGGRGLFAFEVKGDQPVTIPMGFPLNADLTGLDEKADFETTGETTAYPWLSQFNLYRPLTQPPVDSATKELWVVWPDVAGVATEVEEGDRLLIGDLYPFTLAPERLLNTEVVIVEAVRPFHGQTLIKIKGALTRDISVPFVAAYKIGRSFRHFGHNAPPTVTVVEGSGDSASVTQENVDFVRSLDAASGDSVSPLLEALELPLAVEVDDLPSGATVIVDTLLRRESATGAAFEASQAVSQGLAFMMQATQSFTKTAAVETTTKATDQSMALVRKIDGIRPASYTWGALTGPSTVLTLDRWLVTESNPLVDTWESTARTYDRLDVREAQIHETLSPLLLLAAARQETTAASGHELNFFGTEAEAEALAQRQILLTQEAEDPVLASVQAVQAWPALFKDRKVLRGLTLDVEVDYDDFPNPDAEPLVTVYGNLAEATQGKSEPEAVLGNGDARAVFQTFKIPKDPLTYLLDPGATPPEAPELAIYVNDRLWTRVDSLFGRDAKEQVYIVREDAEGASWVQFGDGKTGARLPTGVGNVVARYRSGQGAYGGLKPDTKVNAGGRLERLDKIQLPGVVSGGAEPESGDNAREAAPGKVQSLGRMVSLRDYETETLAIPGVWRATAAWDIVDNVPSVVITILMETGREAELDEVRQVLNHSNRCRGPDRHPIIVIEGALHAVWIDAEFAVEASFREDLVLPEVQAALGVSGMEGEGIDGSQGLLAPGLRRFGDKEYATRVEATIQNVEGVLWSRVKGFGPASADEGETPPAVPWPRNAVAGCPSDRILYLPAEHLALASVAPPPAEDC